MTQISGQATANGAEKLFVASSVAFGRREKYRAIFSAALCLSAFWWTGRTFHIPYAQVNGSLLAQPVVMPTLIVVSLVFAVLVIVGSLIAGVIGFDAGVLCACIGLCAISVRGGAMRYTLFDEPTSMLWVKLSAEIILLAAIIAGGAFLQHLLARRQLLFSDDHRLVVIVVHTSPDQRALALLTNVVVTTVLMMLLAATDRKAQVLAAVAIASFLGTMAAYSLVPTRPSAWYWIAPIGVGIFGYLMQMAANSASWQIGEMSGVFAGLARALPLDYAGIGVPAAILAYWISRRWQHEREIASVVEPVGV